MPYSAEYWHRRGERIRRQLEKMKDRLNERDRELMRQTADDCDRLAKRARDQTQAGEAIDRLLETPFTHRRSK
jgi:hypothetical protein